MKTKKHRQAKTCQDAVSKLDAFCQARGFDYGVEIDVASECCWGAEVRVTPYPNDPKRPDVSLVFFAGGGADALDVLQRCVREALAFFREGDKKLGSVVNT
jgi:hypothetical protein